MWRRQRRRCNPLLPGGMSPPGWLAAAAAAKEGRAEAQRAALCRRQYIVWPTGLLLPVATKAPLTNTRPAQGVEGEKPTHMFFYRYKGTVLNFINKSS